MISKKAVVDRVKNYYLSPSGAKKIPYRRGVQLINWFCTTSYARTKYFRKKVKLFRTYAKGREMPAGKQKILSEMLATLFLKKWRLKVISNLSEKQFDKYISFQNLETLKKSYESGKGVILLNSHYGLAEVALSIFPNKGFENFHTVVGAAGADSEKFTGINPEIQANRLVFEKFSDAELFKVLLKAKHVLNDGGIVHILGDAYHGKSNLTLPFLGKLRGFRPSFAELALSTQAEIIPVFIYPGKKQKVIIELHPPLDMGKEEDEKEIRVRKVVEQYTDLLEEKWKRMPQFINPGHMDRYLQLVDEKQA